MASAKIYQFYSELNDFTPRIWRRFQVRKNITMAQLGYIVMSIYRMNGHHLMKMIVPPSDQTKESHKNLNTEDPVPTIHLEFMNFPDYEEVKGPNNQSMEITTAKLRDYISGPGCEVTLLYDFGDSWEVAIKLEEVITDSNSPEGDLPCVIDGEGYGIIEDCGGIPGLEELDHAYRTKQGDSYDALRKWMGTDDFSITSFDKAEINLLLKTEPEAFRNAYERYS